MPALVLLGRKWSVGSDDLVFPALFEIIVRVIWLVINSIIWHRYFTWTYSCTFGGIYLRAYLIGIVCVLSLVILELILLMNRSAQGVIKDIRARKMVGPLLIVKILLNLPEIGVNTFGTVLAFTEFVKCDEKEFTNIKVIVLFNWALFALTFIGFMQLLDPVHSTKLNVEQLASQQKRIFPAWLRKCRWLFCLVMRDKNSYEAFTDVAGLLGDLFRGKDICPSDFVAGCILLHVKQKLECPEQRYTCTSDVDELFKDKPAWMSLKKAQHYMKLSTATYGWLYLFYRHICTAICKLIPNITCCACFRSQPSVKGDNCFWCNFAAMRYMSELQSKDFLYSSFKNNIFESPFCVLADHKTRSILIIIRGSISLSDALTDLVGTPDELHIEGIPAGCLAHKGMVSGAEYIKKELEERKILDKAFAEYPNYGLALTGHSLGAAISVLLGFMLRPKYPDLKAYPFSCPGSMVSREVAKLSEEFIMSVGLGEDIVTRLGVASAEDLINNISYVIQACQLPKYRIFLKGFGYAIFGIWCGDLQSTCKSDQIHTPSDINFNDSQNFVLQELSSAPSFNSRLYMPGQILHITRKKQTKEERTAAKKIKKDGCKYEMRWASPEDFNEIRIMNRMMRDHLPENVQKSIDKVLNYQESNTNCHSIVYD